MGTSPLENLAGRGFGVRFRSPLDRLRRANELIGIQQTIEFAGQIAQFDASVLDRIDADKALDLAQEITGAPRSIFKRDEEVEELRAEREQLESAQGLLQGAGQLAAAAGDATINEENANDLLDQLGLTDASGLEAGAPGEPVSDPGLPEPV